MIFRESYIQPLIIHHFLQMIIREPYIPPPTSFIFQIICTKSYIPLCWNLALSGFWNSFRLSDCQTLVIYWLEESHLRRRCFRGWNWGGFVQIGVKLKRPLFMVINCTIRNNTGSAASATVKAKSFTKLVAAVTIIFYLYQWWYNSFISLLLA